MDVRFHQCNLKSRCCAVAVPAVRIRPVLQAAWILEAVCLCVLILRITMQIL